MLKLARQLAMPFPFIREKADKLEEMKSKIARAKSLVDPTAIVLVDEFKAWAAGPAHYTPKKTFSRIFGENCERIDEQIESLRIVDVQGGHHMIAPFIVPYDHFHGDEKIRLDVEIAARATKIVSNNIGLAKREIGKYMDEKVKSALIAEIESDEYNENISEEIKAGGFPAHYFQVIAEAMDHCKYNWGKGGIAQYETTSVLNGEGQSVVTFWENVAKLHDYSGSFPDKKPPQANKPKDKKERSMAWGAKPAWGF